MDYPGKVITKTQVTPTQTSASGNWTLDDQAAAIKNNNWPVALVPNPISKSLRFNSADSAYLNRTPASAGNANTWTWSGWVKRSALGSVQVLFSAATDTNNFEYFRFESTDELFYTRYVGGAQQDGLTTTAVFRDPSAWYHIVVVRNGATRTIYVNNVSMASGGSNASTGEINQVKAHSIGRRQETASQYFSGYMTETYMIDGQALTPSSFGMTNPQTGQWIPKKYTGTYGTNGFYLNFKDATSTTTLGYDYSGNANNWTTNNFSVTAGSGNDSLTDVPTPWVAYSTTGDVGGVVRGNYATFNALQLGSSTTLNNGNLDSAATASSFNTVIGTMFASSGKWYAEVTILDVSADYSTKRVGVGIIKDTGTEQGSYLGSSTSGYGYYANATRFNNATSASYGATYVTNDVIGIAMDLDAGTLVFYKNNTSQGTAYSGLSGAFSFAASHYGSGAKVAINFGQRPFAYTPPAGFRSLCTTNLPATTIGFGLTNQGGNYFNIALWNGDGATSRAITGLGHAPNFVWIKKRTSGGTVNRDHVLYDIIRGTGANLRSNQTNAESTGNTDELKSFDSDGFTLGSGDNVNGATGTPPYVGWSWKAGGTGVTNTAGTITSTVSANTTAGFSIVTYTGTGANATVGHGLGVAPSMVIVKSRASARDWPVYHVSPGNTQYAILNGTGAFSTASTFWNNTSPTSTVFSIGTALAVNASENYVAYCFAAVAGYSAFGSYTGNNNADGVFIYTGFRPRWLMCRERNGANNWHIYDSSRSPFNVVDDNLKANLSNAEETTSSNQLDFLSNGFKWRTADHNNQATPYIYAAFAESPFQFANAR